MSNANRKMRREAERAGGGQKVPKILIGVPSNRDMSKEFIASLLPLVAQVGFNNLVFMQNGMINQCRDSIVRVAVERGYDYIFWLDDDMIVPADALVKLLSHNKDIASGLYFGRGNYLPLMFDMEQTEENGETFYEFQNHTEYKDNDLMKVDAIGFGCVLTKVSALVKVWNDEREGVGKTCFDFIGGLGEDLSFAIRCRLCGVETWVDTSIKCGHMGRITVTEDTFKLNHSEG